MGNRHVASDVTGLAITQVVSAEPSEGKRSRRRPSAEEGVEYLGSRLRVLSMSSSRRNDTFWSSSGGVDGAPESVRAAAADAVGRRFRPSTTTLGCATMHRGDGRRTRSNDEKQWAATGPLPLPPTVDVDVTDWHKLCIDVIAADAAVQARATTTITARRSVCGRYEWVAAPATSSTWKMTSGR